MHTYEKADESVGRGAAPGNKAISWPGGRLSSCCAGHVLCPDLKCGFG